MIDYESVEIFVLNLNARGYEEIYQNLKMLYTTPVGTVPFDRNFGIDLSFIDEPIPIAQGLLMVQYRQKTIQYEPRARVQEVTFQTDALNGKITPKVVIEFEPNT